jgi:hypothetical protein
VRILLTFTGFHDPYSKGLVVSASLRGGLFLLGSGPAAGTDRSSVGLPSGNTARRGAHGLPSFQSGTKDAFVTVGGGRGFLVESRLCRLVITAVHGPAVASAEADSNPLAPTKFPQKHAVFSLLEHLVPLEWVSSSSCPFARLFRADPALGSKSLEYCWADR